MESNIDIDKAKEMLLKGINVLDQFSKIFIIHIQTKTSIPVIDRRNDIYQNVILCETNCYLSNINYETNVFRCICKLIPPQDEEENEPNTFFNPNHIYIDSKVLSTFISNR